MSLFNELAECLRPEINENLIRCPLCYSTEHIFERDMPIIECIKPDIIGRSKMYTRKFFCGYCKKDF